MLMRRGLWALSRAPLMTQASSFRLRAEDPRVSSVQHKDPKAQEISEEFSGVAQKVLQHPVTIGKPPANSMQSIDYYDFWEIRFPEGRQWHDALMGWTKNDGVSRWARDLLVFPSKKDAISFCERNGIYITPHIFHFII